MTVFSIKKYNRVTKDRKMSAAEDKSKSEEGVHVYYY